jgi:hypothetical protein
MSIRKTNFFPETKKKTIVSTKSRYCWRRSGGSVRTLRTSKSLLNDANSKSQTKRVLPDDQPKPASGYLYRPPFAKSTKPNLCELIFGTAFVL